MFEAVGDKTHERDAEIREWLETSSILKTSSKSRG